MDGVFYEKSDEACVFDGVICLRDLHVRSNGR